MREISKKDLEKKDFDSLVQIAIQQNKEIHNLEVSLNAQVKVSEMYEDKLRKINEKPEVARKKLEKIKEAQLRVKESKLKREAKFN